MENLCLRLSNIDRVGLVQDISNILAAYNINIVSMEVQPNTIYLEIEQLSGQRKDVLLDNFIKVAQIVNVQEILYMPHQQTVQQLQAVLSTVSDGIIAINYQQQITQYNPAAEKIVHLPYEKVIGQPFSAVFNSGGFPLLDTLKDGLAFDNREVFLQQTKGHYLTSARPIKDSAGRINGAVAILKDIGDVRKIVDSFTGLRKNEFHDILYQSQAMRKVVETIKAIATGTSTVFIRGETGTGKELVARAIHATAPQAQKMFVPINCAAIPEALLESELFGYERGAFTGAEKSGKPGLFEFADGGTLFLDEVGELPLTLQAKLLRVLQERRVRRIGSSQEIPVDVRIIAATNQELEKMVADGRFRADLYYRLNVIPLFVPALRERREDIPLLTRNFFQRFSIRLHKTVSTISETAMTKLIQYDWPGNIRELENVIERAVNLVMGAVILAEHISFDYDFKFAAASQQSQPATKSYGTTITKAVAQVEYDILVQAMRQYHTSRTMGRALGLSHTTVIKKMHKYGLKFPQYDS